MSGLKVIQQQKMSNFQLPPGMRPANPPSGSGGGSSQQGGGGGGNNEEAQAKAAQQEEMKRGMIAAMLEPAARERCRFPFSYFAFHHLDINLIVKESLY